MVQKGDQLGEDERRRQIAQGDLRGFCHEQGGMRVRPEAIAEQGGDVVALEVIFRLADRSRQKLPVREIALHQEVDILLRHLGQGESEEGLLGLEITGLQQAQDLFGQALGRYTRADSSSVRAKYSARWKSSKSGRPYSASHSVSDRTVRFLSRARIGGGSLRWEG